MIGKPKVYLKVFSFLISVGGERFGVESCRWEGPHFIITRGLEKDHKAAPSLYSLWQETRTGDDLVSFGRPEVLVELLANNGDVARRWRIEYARALNRGPDLLHAVVDENAREAVCLLNAHAVAVRT